ncbi:AraC family transcriptional regulator [Aquimarina sp. AU58]|uniref:helix-turn-helix domain-containing protein n=1 Tax=Aquimarina sp. AU58 TaxID=1874112 RepID=UPI000D654017|nr:AraC family transcriptional regulator [Aquimarina sp. AU58]
MNKINYIKWEDYISFFQANNVNQSADRKMSDLNFSQKKSVFNDNLMGNGTIINLPIRDEINLYYFDVLFNKELTIEKKNDTDMICFIFCLEGCINWYNEYGEKKTLIKGNFAFCKIIERISLWNITPNKNTPHEIVAISFSINSFIGFLGERVNLLPVGIKEVFLKKNKLYKISPMSHNLYLELKLEKFEPKKDVSHQLYIESWFYKLVSYVIGEFSIDEGQKHRKKLENISLLARICDDIKADIFTTPSLIVLSKKYEIREDDIIHLFKSELNTTPIRFLQDYRLLKAKELLVSDQEDVNTAAYSVGYSSVSSFSRAFMKKFGVRPGTLNSRK